MWLGQRGGEARRGEARRGVGRLANEGWRNDGCQWGERKEKTEEEGGGGGGWQMTPQETKKGGDTAAKPALSPIACLHCMYGRSDGMQAKQAS